MKQIVNRRLCDAHLHLASLSGRLPLEPLLAEAREQGITHYLSSALTKEDIALELMLKEHYGQKVLFSAGIHPFYPACNLELRDIEELAERRQIWAVGEIGLDRANRDYEKMLQSFTKQLDIALRYSLPVILHIVGHQQAAYDLLKRYPLKYLIHGYAGSVEAFEKFLQLNSFFTISERIIKRDKEKLLRAMLQSGRYLFETDMTYEYVHKGEENPLLRLNKLFDYVAESQGILADELEETQRQNYFELTGLSL